ncbi:MAG: hypothetical protein H6815_10540 [Phycisphaeraceae bacterium]|nr:hypothetical protein [Phycisphaerales bacterium]MCB9860876.1 hypothetical protein [Phycisphaeraceae bacterium]
MNVSQFLEHWGLHDNPFRGEEARNDGVLRRLTTSGPGAPAGFVHSAFDKVLGSIEEPSTAIVFGEKGSGKTAIRLQLEQHVAIHNASHAGKQTLLVAYDDLNTVLDRLHERIGSDDPLESFRQVELADHMDALLGLVVPGVVDAILGQTEPGAQTSVTLQPMTKQQIRSLDQQTREDVLLLQAVYDRPNRADVRTVLLRKMLKLGRPMVHRVWEALTFVAWAPAVAILIWLFFFAPERFSDGWQRTAVLAGAGACFLFWLITLARVHVIERLRRSRTSRRLHKQLRALSRTEMSYAASIRQLPLRLRETGVLPVSQSEEPRYAMFDRLRRVLRTMGYSGLMVVVDRIDEPSLVSGHAERMRAIIWPLLNNKFLQQQGIGFKLLLPIELRHALMKESSAFFQEARLDKQGLIDRLTWTGSMLYDLCEARLQACLGEGKEQIELVDLFAEDVARRDVVDALDQMHQPRDAFKFLYACITEFCSSVTRTEDNWRIPKMLLDTVRRAQAERVQALYRGITPA